MKNTYLSLAFFISLLIPQLLYGSWRDLHVVFKGNSIQAYGMGVDSKGKIGFAIDEKASEQGYHLIELDKKGPAEGEGAGQATEQKIFDRGTFAKKPQPINPEKGIVEEPQFFYDSEGNVNLFLTSHHYKISFTKHSTKGKVTSNKLHVSHPYKKILVPTRWSKINETVYPPKIIVKKNGTLIAFLRQIYEQEFFYLSESGHRFIGQYSAPLVTDHIMILRPGEKQWRLLGSTDHLWDCDYFYPTYLVSDHFENLFGSNVGGVFYFIDSSEKFQRGTMKLPEHSKLVNPQYDNDGNLWHCWSFESHIHCGIMDMNGNITPKRSIEIEDYQLLNSFTINGSNQFVVTVWNNEGTTLQVIFIGADGKIERKEISLDKSFPFWVVNSGNKTIMIVHNVQLAKLYAYDLSADPKVKLEPVQLSDQISDLTKLSNVMVKQGVSGHIAVSWLEKDPTDTDTEDLLKVISYFP